MFLLHLQLQTAGAVYLLRTAQILCGGKGGVPIVLRSQRLKLKGVGDSVLGLVIGVIGGLIFRKLSLLDNFIRSR